MQTNVALRAISFAAALAYSICIGPTLGLAADPALHSTEVVTPCGGTVQIPGVGEPGKTGCSGNFSTAFEVGNLTVTYNSQFEEYNPSQPSLAPSSGFGRGMRALGELVPNGQTLKLILPDGSQQTFESRAPRVWESSRRILGDLSYIRSVGETYELVSPPSSHVITFGFISNGRYYPTEVRDEHGPRLQLLEYSTGPVAIPLTIKDPQRGTSTKLSLSSDRYVVTQVTDSRGRSYTLSYAGTGAGRYLTGIVLPNGKRYSLGYDNEGRGYLTSIVNPLGQNHFISYYRHGRLAGIGSATGSSLVRYTASSITTQELNTAGSPLTFSTTLFTGGFVTGERVGNGEPSGEQPGILLSSVTRDPIGRVMITKDQFGAETKLHYNQDGSCSTDLSAPGTSPLPTCVESAGAKTQMTYDANYQPVRAVRTDSTGQSTSTEMAWDSDRPTRESIKDSQGRTTSERSVEYENGFPVRVTSKTTTYFDEWDPEVRGRLKRFTSSSGVETAYQFDGNGEISSATMGGSTSSFSSSIQPNGSRSVSIVRDGIQASMTSNFLGTETSRSLSKVGAPPDTFSASSSSSVKPGLGTVRSSATSTVSGKGGRIAQQASSTEVIDWRGKRTTSSSFGVSGK